MCITSDPLPCTSFIDPCIYDMLALISGLMSSENFLEGNHAFGEMPSESCSGSRPKSPAFCCKFESTGILS
jgi:hypothetical protein